MSAKSKQYTLSTNRIMGILLISIYVILLVYYYGVVSQSYEYMGYAFNHSIYSVAFCLCCVIAIIPATFIPSQLDTPSSLVFYVLYFIVYIPSCIIPYLIGVVPENICIGYNVAMLVGLSFIQFARQLPPLQIPTISVSNRTDRIISAGLFLTIMGGFLLIFLLLRQYFHLTSFANVYQQRSVFVEQMGKLPAIIRYFFNWQTAVFSPWFIILGILWKKPLLSLLGITIAVVFYGFSAEKSVISQVIIVLLMFFFILKSKNISLWFVSLTMNFVLLLSSVWLIWLQYFVRRIIITPGLLASWYVNFSNQHHWLYLSESLFRHFSHYPFATQGVPEVVSQFNIGRAHDANANFIASSALDFGHILGPIITCLILAMFLWLYDSIAKSIKIRKGVGLYKMSIVMLIPLCLALANTSLPVSLWSNGAILVALLNYGLLCRQQDKLFPAEGMQQSLK